MILSIEGPEKSTKSTIAYTAPLPIVAFSYDMGHDRALYGAKHKEFFAETPIDTHRFVDGAKPPKPGPGITVYVMPQPLRMGPAPTGFVAQWRYMLEIFVEEAQKPEGTIVIDTMTLLNRNKRDAYLEELNADGKHRTNLMQIEYGRPNADVRQLYTFAQSQGKNMVCVHHLKEHYAPAMVNGQMTTAWDGSYDLDSIGDTYRYVDVAIRTEVKKGKPWSKFMVCGPSLDLVGRELPDMTWDKLMREIEESGWSGKPFDRRKEPPSG